MSDVERYREALEARRPQHVEELRRLIEIPSVSAQDRGIDEAVEEVSAVLRARDLDVEVHDTGGHPAVTASGGNLDGPVLLFYEHYDVQPSDPDDEWSVPPFELTERDGRLYGRGTADTKGHLVCRLAAIDAVRDVLGDDRIGYRFLVEGEEEIGSPNLEPFIESHADALRADGCLWEFGSVDDAGRPQIHCGLKGILSAELRAHGPARDAHSSLGAVIDNPMYRLAAAVASLRDPDGRVTIEGFYDDVDEVGPEELAALEAQPDRDDELREHHGVATFLGGATGTELLRRLQCEPCLNVNGIHGGYGGSGTKTVLPARGLAKLDLRLVPSQRPERVLELLREHLDAQGFADVEVVRLAGEGPGRTPLDDPFVGLVRDAAREAYEVDPVLHVSSAGTGPAHPFREVLGVPFASAGCAYPGSRGHAPDEHVRITDFERAKLHSALIVARMGGG